MSCRLRIRISVGLVAFSFAVAGCVLANAKSDLTGVDGYLAISPGVIVRQGNGVDYSFADVAILSHLEVTQDSVVLNNWLIIGAEISEGHLSNMIVDYRPDCVSWVAVVSDSSSNCTYRISGLNASSGYEVYQDGILIWQQDSGSGTVEFAAIGDGHYEIIAQDPLEIPMGPGPLSLVIITITAIVVSLTVTSRRTKR